MLIAHICHCDTPSGATDDDVDYSLARLGCFFNDDDNDRGTFPVMTRRYECSSILVA